MGLGTPLASLGIGMPLCLVICVSLTSAAPATMPLPFTLTSRLGLIRLRLRLILLCHACTSRCVGNSCSLLMIDPPGRGKAEIGCNSCFHLVDGQRPRPRTQKELFQKITVWGRNLWFDLSNKLLVLSVPLLIGPATKHPYLGQQMRTRQKNPIDSRELRRA